jgi:hypothetical protein
MSEAYSAGALMFLTIFVSALTSAVTAFALLMWAQSWGGKALPAADSQANPSTSFKIDPEMIVCWLDALTCDELRSLLRARAQSTSGLKVDLKRRLAMHSLMRERSKTN